MADDKRIPAAGEAYKVEGSTKWVKKGHHDTGTPRNEGLPHPDTVASVTKIIHNLRSMRRTPSLASVGAAKSK